MMTVNGRQCLGKDQRRQPTAFNESTVYCLYLPPTECLFTTPHGPHVQGYRHAHRAHTILSVLGGRHAVKNEPGARSRYIGRGRQRLSRVDKLISYRKHYPAATSVTIPYASQPHYNSTTQRLAAYLLAGYRRRWSLSISSHYQITSFDVLIRPSSCIFLLFSYYYHRSCRQVYCIYDIQYIHKYLIKLLLLITHRYGVASSKTFIGYDVLVRPFPTIITITVAGRSADTMNVNSRPTTIGRQSSNSGNPHVRLSSIFGYLFHQAPVTVAITTSCEC